MDGSTCDVLIVEDVDVSAFTRPEFGWTVVHRPDLWHDRAALAAAIRDTRALVVRNQTAVDRALLSAAPRLQVVARAGVGLDNIDLDATTNAGIVVVAPLGANARSVAEHTIGLALAAARDITVHDARTKAGEWRRTPGTELAGSTWGLLGVGATGLAVARLATALGCRIIGYDAHLPLDDPRVAAAGVTLLDLDRTIRESNVLSIHLPATPSTTGMIDEQFLARMRIGSLLINVGRGEVIDEPALARALTTTGRPGRAALDVRTTEPPGTGTLETLDSVILTPHIAGATRQAAQRIGAALAADVDAVLSGREATNAVGGIRAADAGSTAAS